MQEIDRIGREGVPQEEMDRLRTEALRRRALQMVTTTSRADTFVQLFGAAAPADLINRWEDREHSISSEDLRRVVKKYLGIGQRTTIIVMPPGAAR